jgi:hypothetical protein
MKVICSFSTTAYVFLGFPGEDRARSANGDANPREFMEENGQCRFVISDGKGCIPFEPNIDNIEKKIECSKNFRSTNVTCSTILFYITGLLYFNFIST